jgi:hypothetical protein
MIYDIVQKTHRLAYRFHIVPIPKSQLRHRMKIFQPKKGWISIQPLQERGMNGVSTTRRICRNVKRICDLGLTSLGSSTVFSHEQLS